MFNRSMQYKRNHFRLIALVVALVLALSGFAALAEEAPDDAAAQEYLDKQSGEVRAAQRRLIDLGFLRGKADGVYGRKTKAALEAYQSQNGLEPTGHLDAQTFALLTEVTPDTADARDVQQRLIDLGYLQGAADGVIGPKSTEALSLFQRLNGLSITGKVNDATLARLFSDQALAVPAVLSGGSRGEDVEKLQGRLNLFGFFDGEPDGSYGQSTTAAVRDFQQHLIEQGYTEGIEADGIASPLTQFCLYSDRYSTYLRDVEAGISDPEALRVERRLLQLGYIDLAADDVLDESSVAALEQFKRQAGIITFATADQGVVDALFSEEAPVAERCVAHAIASGDGGIIVANVEAALVRGGMLIKHTTGTYSGGMEDAVERLYKYLTEQKDPKAPLYADKKALSMEAVQTLLDGLLENRFDNTRGTAEIKRAQCRLYTLLYLPRVGIDGKFGRDTKNALKAFQAANGLAESGTTDAATQSILFTDAALAKPYPYRVEVSIDRQEVDVFERNETGTYDLVKTFTCSTGLHDSTPRGVFLDGHPINRWHKFVKFNCWAQYSFEITGDIMFHSVLYGSNNEKSLRSGSLYALGNPASHGCVRLSVEDAKYLFEHCKRGKVVIIIY
ncbi:MAG: murein L,D-transpeptidase [Clostridia bacterium]|nr:murein L,D-transpeptidase [Clostridia bacterium]